MIADDHGSWDELYKGLLLLYKSAMIPGIEDRNPFSVENVPYSSSST
jgi:hypothetical protein